MEKKMWFRSQFLNGIRWYVVYLDSEILVFPTRKGPGGYRGVHANLATERMKFYPRVAGR